MAGFRDPKRLKEGLEMNYKKHKEAKKMQVELKSLQSVEVEWVKRWLAG